MARSSAKSGFDAVIIGAGHNGLTTAAYLARAGKRVLVVEKRPRIGGTVETAELHPGYRFSPIAPSCNPFPERIVRDLQLGRHGLEFLRVPHVLSCPLPDGGGLVLEGDPTRDHEAIRKFSSRDADRYGEFLSTMRRLSRSLRPLITRPPPAAFPGGPKDALELLMFGGRLRRLGRKDLAFLLRILPMSLTDFLEDWFETDLLRSVLAAGCLIGSFAGPYSPGTASLLLFDFLTGTNGGVGERVLPRGGMGSLSAALAAAAESRGAVLRTDAPVDRVLIREGAARGVVLENGEEIDSRVVISNADPRRTFLHLLGPAHLEPGFLEKISHYRMHGVTAMVHLALRDLPRFTLAPNGNGIDPRSGRIRIGPSLEYLERAYDDAKYGNPSGAPFLEAMFPSLTDPSLAPDGGHVLSILVQYAPYHLRDGNWEDRREDLGDTVVDLISKYAPDLRKLIASGTVLSPLDLERDYGLTEGHIHHGEHSLEQLFTFRPLPECSRYATPIRNFFLCGAGTHPGGGVQGLCGYNAARQILREARWSGRL